MGWCHYAVNYTMNNTRRCCCMSRLGQQWTNSPPFGLFFNTFRLVQIDNEVKWDAHLADLFGQQSASSVVPEKGPYLLVLFEPCGTGSDTAGVLDSYDNYRSESSYKLLLVLCLVNIGSRPEYRYLWPYNVHIDERSCLKLWQCLSISSSGRQFLSRYCCFCEGPCVGMLIYHHFAKEPRDFNKTRRIVLGSHWQILTHCWNLTLQMPPHEIMFMLISHFGTLTSKFVQDFSVIKLDCEAKHRQWRTNLCISTTGSRLIKILNGTLRKRPRSYPNKVARMIPDCSFTHWSIKVNMWSTHCRKMMMLATSCWKY